MCHARIGSFIPASRVRSLPKSANYSKIRHHGAYGSVSRGQIWGENLGGPRGLNGRTLTGLTCTNRFHLVLLPSETRKVVGSIRLWRPPVLPGHRLGAFNPVLHEDRIFALCSSRTRRIPARNRWPSRTTRASPNPWSSPKFLVLRGAGDPRQRRYTRPVLFHFSSEFSVRPWHESPTRFVDILDRSDRRVDRWVAHVVL